MGSRYAPVALPRPDVADPVTLQSAIEAELPYLRVEAEAMMVDAGTAKRPTGGYEYDPAANGGEGGDVLAADDLFTSPCKIQTRNLVAREEEVGGRTSVSVRTELHLPASTDPLQVGDLWELTAVNALSLGTVGQRLRIVGPVAGTLKTARRYEVVEVVS